MAENATVTTVDLEVLKERQPTQDELDAIGLEALNEGDAKTKSDEDKEIERIAKEQAEAADKSDKETKETKKESKKEENIRIKTPEVLQKATNASSLRLTPRANEVNGL